MLNIDDDNSDRELQDLERVIKMANDMADKLSGIGQINPMQYIQQASPVPLTPQILPPDTPSPDAVILQYINVSNNPDLKFEHNGDSGFDLRANLTTPVIIKSKSMGVIPTGLFFEVSPGYEIQIRSRSGLAMKQQIFVLNQPGTIDFGYRNEILVMLYNIGDNDVQINHGDRIAQGVVCPVAGSGKLTLLKTDQLSPSDRNQDGFGSTGIK